MAYTDVIKAIQDLKAAGVNSPELENKAADSKGINPYSSAAYGFSADSIYKDVPEVTDPRTLYRRYGKGNWMTQGGQGLMGYKMGAGLDPFAKDIAGTFGASFGDNWSGFGPAGALYGATQNQNPYDFTQTEKLGTIGTTALAARSLAPMLNPVIGKALSMPLAGSAAATAAGVAGTAPILGMHPALLVGSLLLGNMFAKKKKRRAQKANEEAIESVNEQRREGYESRSEKLIEAREERDASFAEQLHAQEAGRYANQYGGNYNRPMAEKGMKFTPKEMKKMAKAGRNGDTMLAHINPQEAALLKALGGSGTINPYTGMPEYFFRRFFRSLGNALTGGASAVNNALNTIGVTDALSTGFGAVNQALDPVHNVAHNVVSTAGDLTNTAIEQAVDAGVETLKAGGGLASDTMKQANKVIEPVLRPIMEKGMDIANPIMDVIEDVTTPAMGFLHDTAKMGIEGFFDVTKDVGHGVIDFLDENLRPILFGSPSSAPPGLVGKQQQQKIDRKNLSRNQAVDSAEGPTGESMLSGLKQQAGGEKLDFADAGWLSDKDNPYIRENVEMYDKGGKANIVAEFTGNELIVNNQDAVEKGLASGNYAKAAAPIRQAMKRGYVTPGIETHRGNPMPVDESGTIYTKGGKLKFKVNKGAGIYDHATDQFKPNMTDKEIAMVAKKNIAKWKSNGMA
tara:strand:+ start:3799 stop:5847 length:2049 start_codon:yes stop_codon:yes gene_type:complete